MEDMVVRSVDGSQGDRASPGIRRGVAVTVAVAGAGAVVGRGDERATAGRPYGRSPMWPGTRRCQEHRC